MGTNPVKREFTRVKIAIDVEIKSGETTIISSKTENLSLRGVYVYSDTMLPVGTPCAVTLFLGWRESGVQAQAAGKVVRIDKNGMGLEFVHIEGVESYSHLRNLVLYNAGDTEKVEQEFQNHLGIRRRPQ